MNTTIMSIEDLNYAIANSELLMLPQIVMNCGNVFFTNTAFQKKSSGDVIYVCNHNDKLKYIIQSTDVDCDGIFHYTWEYQYEKLTEDIGDLEIIEIERKDIFDVMIHYSRSEYFAEKNFNTISE